MNRKSLLTAALFALLTFGAVAVFAQSGGEGMMMADSSAMMHNSGSMMGSGTMMQGTHDMPMVTRAVCVLYPTAGSTVHGVVHFSQTDQGVKIVADVMGLTKGKHGFHIHQYGDITAPDGTSTGGHFNPMNEMHGGPMAKEHHEGDMGNLVADGNGVAHYEYTDPSMYLNGPFSIIGRGIVVHAGEDDLTSQPTGAAGARAAVGVIGIAK